MSLFEAIINAVATALIPFQHAAILNDYHTVIFINPHKEKHMDLGAFSISLPVNDIVASKAFYEKLGFRIMEGKIEDGWLILKNNEHVIGLFQGMFEKPMLTFNPGWTQNGQNTDTYTDIRTLREELKRQGITLSKDDIQNESGPASLVLEDPDGNPILIDQHR